MFLHLESCENLDKDQVKVKVDALRRIRTCCMFKKFADQHKDALLKFGNHKKMIVHNIPRKYHTTKTLGHPSAR